MQKTLTVINLSDIRRNADVVRKKIGDRKFYAVVKANAYGHGAIEVARQLEDLVDGFCVAIVDEGVELRVGGISKPIIVFAPPVDGEDVVRLRHYNLMPTVADISQAKLIEGMPCQIKINTGMNRYGCNINKLKSLLSHLDKGQIDGVYSHLYMADDDKESCRQLECFKLAEGMVKSKNPNAVAHIAASGGILRGGDFLCDGVRCGIMLYGYAPSGYKCSHLSPSMRVYARRMQVTSPFGGGVGYNKREELYDKLYTYRTGYADGFARTVPLGEKSLCMDAYISKKDGGRIDVCGGIYAGQWQLIFDDADSYASKCGTISYEVLCSVTRRSNIIYER